MPRPKTLIVNSLAVFGALTIAWVLYITFTPEQAEIPPERLSVQRLVDEDMPATLAANLNAPLIPGNSVQVLLNGDEIFPAMLKAINEAKQSVNFLSYVFRDGAIARRFTDALSAAARRGVEVRVLIDAIGGAKMPDKFIKQLKDAGCKFGVFHPLRWYNVARFNNRTHRKVLVVDGRIGFTGGVGIADEWTGDGQDPQHWRDDQFRVEGPVVRYLQGSFAVNWRQATGEVLAGKSMFPSLPTTGTVRILPVDAAPGDGISEIAFVYWLLFHSAQHSIVIETPYFVPDPRLDLGLADAAKRGVDVTLLVPGRYQSTAVVAYASETYYRALLEAGVHIHEYQQTMLHTKLVTVDDRWALIGSPNFDARSFSLNYEEALVVFDQALVTRLRASAETDLAHSTSVTLADVKAKPWWDWLRNQLALALRSQL